MRCMNNGEYRGSSDAVIAFREGLRAGLAQIAAAKVIKDMYPEVGNELPKSPEEAYLLGRLHEKQANQQSREENN